MDPGSPPSSPASPWRRPPWRCRRSRSRRALDAASLPRFFGPPATPRPVAVPDPAAASVHGAERALEPARRRLPVRRPPGPRAARAPDGEALDVPRGRVRVGHVRLARADRDGLRRARGPEAAAARPADAGDARGARRCRRACRAPATSFTGLRRRRLLLPRPPRPRGRPDDDAARLRDPPDRAAARASSSSATTTSPRAVLPGDKIISALPDWSGRLWFASHERRRRHGRPGERRGALAAARGADRATRSRSTRHGRASTSSPTRRCTASRPAPTGVPEVAWREPYENIGRAEARADAAPGRGRRRR